jgi:hypothetical protein
MVRPNRIDLCEVGSGNKGCFYKHALQADKANKQPDGKQESAAHVADLVENTIKGHIPYRLSVGVD